MIDWNAVRARQERYQDLLHDAEKYRLKSSNEMRLRLEPM
jgi:hypothetical protein